MTLARRRLRRTRYGGWVWVFKPDGRSFYREVVVAPKGELYL